MATTKYIVDNKAEQEIDGDLAIGGDLAIDGDVNITGNTNIRPYKVYTALLTQTGGDDPLQVIGDGNTPGSSPPNNIIKDVTYTITSNTDGDFTTFGAPNNDVGTSFVATQNVGYYTATFELDYNTGAPVVTVLENTIGNIWFSYNTIGRYNVNSDGLFTLSKTYSTIESQATDTVADGIKTATITYDNSTANTVVINTGIVSDTVQDSYLFNTPFEIITKAD
jgi:hypothetical protein